jgi:hypothetical protein
MAGVVLTAVHAETTLKAYINYGDLVPQELFGFWKRTRYIEKSSAGEMEGVVEEGNWAIFRDGKRIVLQNPETGVQTEVQVESVHNGTAVFNYNKKLANGNWCHEQLTLTPENEGMALSGFQVKECYQPTQGGKGFTAYYQAFARVNGLRDQSLPPIR